MAALGNTAAVDRFDPSGTITMATYAPRSLNLGGTALTGWPYTTAAAVPTTGITWPRTR